MEGVLLCVYVNYRGVADGHARREWGVGGWGLEGGVFFPLRRPKPSDSSKFIFDLSFNNNNRHTA